MSVCTIHLIPSISVIFNDPNICSHILSNDLELLLLLLGSALAAISFDVTVTDDPSTTTFS